MAFAEYLEDNRLHEMTEEHLNTLEELEDSTVVVDGNFHPQV
eukprot:CAMPEP_0202975724 /NCGR_PEP_ID=MMETSP1396-20130829/71428_1 /ASSEMBLY_ACC=CAM_ASM_000872 /TAXON_ID= /ORGANISM="Pseudokeronopsis sp., Strain Brazil" /LENGTH=41 /DNA_ID= /DNA_START= /DNA_END= /DNA_ORIENTATION=